ncbi:MAG: choice-of-anchor Q domain-containing protein, partial [Lentisphaeria bacterium]
NQANFGGGIGLRSATAIENCLIIHNQSPDLGAAIFHRLDSNVYHDIVNCTIAMNKNIRTSTTSRGAIVDGNSNGHYRFKNTVFALNDIGLFTTAFGSSANTTMTNCVFGTGLGYPGESIFAITNTNSDNLGPNFKTPSTISGIDGWNNDLDYSLMPNSLLINIGDNEVTFDDDLAGNNRVWNNGVIDIGAYEYQDAALSSSNNFTAEDLIYTGEPQFALVSAANIDSRLPAATWQNSDSKTNAGTYTELSLEDTTGHWITSETIDLTINKVAKSIVGIEENYTAEQAEGDFIINIPRSLTFSSQSTTENGESITFEVFRDEINVTNDNEIVTFENDNFTFKVSGTFTIIFNSVETGNYFAAATVTTNVKLYRGSATVVQAPTLSETQVENNTSLTTITFGNDGIVEADGNVILGTWSWSNQKPVINKDGADYSTIRSAIFTPNDLNVAALTYDYTFTIKTYAVIIDNGSASHVVAARDEIVSISATLDDSAIFNQWLTSSEVIINDRFASETTFVMIASDIMITAEMFADNGIRYISELGAGTKTGINWENAAAISQLENILTSENLTEVRIAGGTYNVSNIQLPASIRISGSWNIANNNRPLKENAIATYDFANPTIFDGQQTAAGSSVIGVTFGIGTSLENGTIFDGIELTRYHIPVNAGGKYTTIKNCIISGTRKNGNSASGINFTNNTSMLMQNCQIIDNHYTGAYEALFTFRGAENGKIVNTIFEKNAMTGNGGIIGALSGVPN